MYKLYVFTDAAKIICVKELLSCWSFVLCNSTHPVILVSRDGHELRLWKDKGLEVLCTGDVFGFRIDVDHVEPRLVFVHGVENNLVRKKK